MIRTRSREIGTILKKILQISAWSAALRWGSQVQCASAMSAGDSPSNAAASTRRRVIAAASRRSRIVRPTGMPVLKRTVRNMRRAIARAGRQTWGLWWRGAAVILRVHRTSARVPKGVCGRAQGRITSSIVASGEIGRRAITRQTVVRDTIRVVRGGREEKRRLAGSEARLLQWRLGTTMGRFEVIQGQGAAVSHCVVHCTTGTIRGTGTAHSLAVAHTLGQGSLLHAAVQCICDHGTPGQDTKAKEAQDCANTNEDGAFRVGRLLHEWRTRKVGDNHSRNPSARQCWEGGKRAD